MIGCGPGVLGGRRRIDRLAYHLADGGDDAFFQPVPGVIDSVGGSRSVQNPSEVPIRIASETYVLAIFGLLPSEDDIDYVEQHHAVCANQCVIRSLTRKQHDSEA